MYQKLLNKDTKVALIGLGYVGLSLSMEFTKCGFTTLGIDVDKNKIQMLENNKSYLKHIKSETIKKYQGTLFFPTCDFDLLKKAKNIIVCVPTPLTSRPGPLSRRGTAGLRRRSVYRAPAQRRAKCSSPRSGGGRQSPAVR